MYIRAATLADRSELLDLLCVSLNYWYRGIGRPVLITGGPTVCSVFWDVYETLDPGCCLVATEPDTLRLMGTCFYRERPTHLSLGIMAVHPNYFGRGVAAGLLQRITNQADAAGKPTRLVSSLMNLDSYSLYTRAGFVPRAVYQDVIVPAEKVATGLKGVDLSRVRRATLADLPNIAALEWDVSQIRRESDWRYFIVNHDGIWTVLVQDAPTGGGLTGALAAVDHPGSQMLGPGVMRDDPSAANLIAAQLTHHADKAPVFLLPADRPELVELVYSWGGKNVELHTVQTRGAFSPFAGVAMPTFMPETA